MDLRQYITERKATKPLLLMTHVVCGYPSFEENMRELEIMSHFDVDLVELQFPFSESMADGPLFVEANQLSLASGTTVDQCFEFMRRVNERFPFKTLMMGYYNTAFKMGHKRFVPRIKENGGSGYILPDLPIEEAGDLHTHSRAEGITPIILMAPTSTDQRLATLGERADGFVYADARKGVTGKSTEMDQEVADFLDRCKRHTDAYLAVGFGISRKEHLTFIARHADIAIIGTAALKAWREGGEIGLDHFFSDLGFTKKACP